MKTEGGDLSGGGGRSQKVLEGSLQEGQKRKVSEECDTNS